MKPRKPRNDDIITLAQAACMLGMSEVSATRFRREGLLVRLEGFPSYSRSDIERFLRNPYLNGQQAAYVLGVSHVRVSPLASSERIPVHVSPSGRRWYRQAQVQVVANARKERLGTGSPAPGDAIWTSDA